MIKLIFTLTNEFNAEESIFNREVRKSNQDLAKVESEIKVLRKKLNNISNIVKIANDKDIKEE